MIDIENSIFTMIATPLREKYEDIFITGEEVLNPSKFPCVSIVETDNYITQSHIDNGDNEKYATIIYTVNVYSNKTSGKKSECKDIMKTIDEMLYKKNFKRIETSPISMEDATIYRIVARYRAETDGQNIYRI